MASTSDTSDVKVQAPLFYSYRACAMKRLWPVVAKGVNGQNEGIFIFGHEQEMKKDSVAKAGVTCLRGPGTMM